MASWIRKSKTNKDSKENVKENISDNKIKVDPVKEKYLRSLIEQAKSNGCEIFLQSRLYTVGMICRRIKRN